MNIQKQKTSLEIAGLFLNKNLSDVYFKIISSIKKNIGIWLIN